MAGPSIGIPAASATARASRLGSLAHFTARYRWPVIAVWVVLTLIGGVAAGKLSTRWYLAAVIIFDATVIRALLVPAVMKLLGDWNWCMPKWTRTVLRIPHRDRAAELPAALPAPVA
jgi:uncharacterized membrane protein YdfJ with MMPL/SSD domain